jgi:hypothetical protein
VSLFRSLVLIILRLSYAMIRLVALLLLGPALASCGTYEPNVGKFVDMIPEWAGGYQKACRRVLERLSTRRIKKG